MLSSFPLVVLPIVIAGLGPDKPLSGVKASNTETTLSVNQGHWTNSLDEARRLSAEKNIPVILHFEASWCGACRRMDTQVLNDSAVREYLGTRLIGMRVDADRHRDLIDTHRVATLPTEIVILPGGAEGGRYVGAISLQGYLSRLQVIAEQVTASGSEKDTASANDQTRSGQVVQTEKTRSCLIVRRDGKMVGLGGFSPVALSVNRRWEAGKEEFIVSFQEVDYFLQSAEEVSRFEANPDRFVPHLHGCDPVELHFSKLARTGAIEFGAFYKGEMFFFASIENRKRFQDNPAWYLESTQQPESESDAARLLDMIR
ncbi:MAG: thioredoxin family protein [Fuerstiella sp.]|nr:thioredoxin family protein [Fuerstiella sp.]